jgi:hypothetical protein
LYAVVALLLAVIALIVVAGIPHVDPTNWQPFVPTNQGEWGRYGWSGIMTAAAVVFFSYTGFESVSAATREAKVPSRDIPVGVLGSLAICAVLYVTVALVMTGLAHYTHLGGAAPMITALENAGPELAWIIPIVSFGIVFGLAAAPIGSMYAQSRILFAMAEDGLLPDTFASVHPVFKTPHIRLSQFACSQSSHAAPGVRLNCEQNIVSIACYRARNERRVRVRARVRLDSRHAVCGVGTKARGWCAQGVYLGGHGGHRRSRHS